MSELEFETALSSEEIDRNFENFDYFTELMNGLEEAAAYSDGMPISGAIVRKRSIGKLPPL